MYRHMATGIENIEKKLGLSGFDSKFAYWFAQSVSFLPIDISGGVEVYEPLLRHPIQDGTFSFFGQDWLRIINSTCDG